jgi:3-oxoacyl-[acyl-carrier-protein] synthase II
MASGATWFNNGTGQEKEESGPLLPWPVAAVRLADIAWPDGKPWVDNKKYASITAQAAVAAAFSALERAGPAEAGDAPRCGTIMAVASSGADELSQVIPRLAALAETDPRSLAKLLYDEVPDYSYIRGIPSQLGQFVSMATGFLGSNVAVYGEAGASGFGALSLATRLLQSGELDRVLVVGVTSAMSPATMVAFDRDDPFGTQASPGRGPFDLHRAGTLIGQGAAALMLEREDVASARGITPMAGLLSCEAICATTRRKALDEALGLVMAQAEQRPGLWWAHGAGSVTLDLEECHIVGSHLDAPTTASKGTIGNAFECAGLIDVALAAEALAQERIPPVGLLEKPDPALGDVDFVVGVPRDLPGLESALVTALNNGSSAATAGAAIVTRGRK